METGALDDTGTAAVLRRLADDAATGRLDVVAGDRSGQVWLRGGEVVTATAPGARARLGDRLVGAGHLSEEDLAEALAAQRQLEVPKRIGELLVERGHIDVETMRSYVRDQVADSVAAMLAWRDGEWRFSPGVEIEEDVPLGLSTENLLLEAARRQQEWEVVLDRLGSLDAVVDFADGGAQGDLSLTPDEWAMLTRIDGASTVAEIADDSGYSQFDTGRIVYGLLSAGIVTIVEDGEFEGVAAADDVAREAAPADEAARDTAARETGAADVPAVPSVPSVPLVPPPAGHDDAAAPPAPPAPAAPERPAAADATPAPRAADVDRNELLREFAALDDVPEEPSEGKPAPPPPRRVSPPSEQDKDDGKRGLFGRFRRG